MLRQAPEVIIRNTWHSGQKADFLISEQILLQNYLSSFWTYHLALASPIPTRHIQCDIAVIFLSNAA